MSIACAMVMHNPLDVPYKLCLVKCPDTAGKVRLRLVLLPVVERSAEQEDYTAVVAADLTAAHSAADNTAAGNTVVVNMGVDNTAVNTVAGRMVRPWLPVLLVRPILRTQTSRRPVRPT